MYDDAVTSPPEPAPRRWTTIGLPARTARERILNAATDLFCHNGYAAVGVDSIAARSGSAKSTLYKHFGSKDALIEAVLEREGAAWRGWFFRGLSEIKGGPEARLSGVFDILETWFADPGFYGCPFINLLSESPTGDVRARDLAARHKDPLVTWLRGQALELGLDPEDTVRKMVVLIDGVIVAAQATREPAIARSGKGLIAAHLEAARARRTG